MEEIKRKRIPNIIDEVLGKRVKQATYKKSDLILSWIYSMLCGGERLEDVKHLTEMLQSIPEYKQPSPDRIGDQLKELASENHVYKTENNRDHQFCILHDLNRLSILIAKKLGLLKETAAAGQCYTLDYDNIVIPCEKYDARYSYKRCMSYLPGVAFIGSVPVYVEGRNGNSSPDFRINETVRRALDMLKENNIRPKRFRSDAAAYGSGTFDLCEEYGMEYFIRADHSTKLYSKCRNSNWEKMTVGLIDMEVTEVEHNLNGKLYRVVITRIETGKPNKYTGDTSIYRGIITNNRSMNKQEVVRFYNQRGTMETHFTALLNDWNWKRLPFSFLNQNTVFMIVGGIAAAIYRYLLIRFSKRTTFVKTTFRLKNFIFHFISIALTWEDGGIPVIYTTSSRDYSRCL